MRTDKYVRTMQPMTPDDWAWWLDNHMERDVHNNARRVGVEGPVVEFTLEAMQRLSDDLRTYSDGSP